MDALALLCTLHADGPATLRRLREAGCPDLEALEALGADDLARALELPPAAARRLLREGRHLSQRLGVELLDGEEVLDTPARPLARSREATPGATRGAGPAPPAPRGDRELLARVLETWRQTGDGGDPARSSDHAPRAGADPPPGLAVGAVDGLDAEVSSALCAAGIHDLDALASADCLALSRASGLAYTRLTRLAFLARRELGARSAGGSRIADDPPRHGSAPAGGALRAAGAEREDAPDAPGPEGSGGPFA